MTELNFELMKDVIAVAKREPRRVQMQAYLSQLLDEQIDWLPFDRDHEFATNYIFDGVLPDVNDCSTAGCVCGWGILLRPQEAEAVRIKHKSGGGLVGRNIFVSIGQELFGLDEQAARCLFYFENWPSEYRDLGEAAGVIALLQQVIDEQSDSFLTAHMDMLDDQGMAEDLDYEQAVYVSL